MWILQYLILALNLALKVKINHLQKQYGSKARCFAPVVQIRKPNHTDTHRDAEDDNTQRPQLLASRKKMWFQLLYAIL